MSALLRVQRYNAVGSVNQASVCDPALAFDHERLRDLVALYAKVRGGRAMPARTDFSARMLAPHLRNLTFVDRVVEQGRPRRYRFRYFGSGMARHLPDCTGRYLDEVIPEPFLSNWHESWDMPLELGMPLRFVTRFQSLQAEYVAVDSFTAPLSDDTGAPCGLLVSSESAPVVAPAA